MIDHGIFFGQLDIGRWDASRGLKCASVFGFALFYSCHDHEKNMLWGPAGPRRVINMESTPDLLLGAKPSEV